MLVLRRLRLPLPRPLPVSSSSSSSSWWWSSTSQRRPAMASSSSAAVVAEGSAARRFWIAASTREAAFAAYTPFLLSLAAGNLRLDAFRHYIAQDAHFLHAFARAYEMAEDCADDDDDRATIAALRKAILQELSLHASVLKEWGVDPTKEIPPSAATAKYTDFLLATAAGKVDGAKGSDKMVTPFEKTKIAAYTVGAMTPCMRLYAYLGKELVVFLKQDENHPYKKWINTYASNDFEGNALQIEELLDKLSISLTDLRNSWNMLSKQYMEEYEECMERLLPPEELKSLDYDQLYKGLEVLAEFEKLANSRVVDSGVLRGMNLEDIRKAGERLILQDGCKNFFQKIGKTRENLNLDIHILSYCWCAELIRSAFSSVGCLDGLNIHSNEFVFEGSVSTGQIERKMQSPLDKVEKFKSIKSGMDSTAPSLSVYIGDSVGDLLCLLEADIGIVVGSSTSLRRVGKQFGVSFVPLFPGLVEKQRQLTEQEKSRFKSRSGVLYTVSSWSEIHAFILGSDFS
ncbi:hypothetical protein PVAP13_6NG366000 [Panicum virgatum]|uniref:Thiaminase-2/PQQC domain-containing protein n=1 Tax=Panicum virgatum TaxID=38727 RepID=A0A8T0R789_PANVG|nr:hypothetical protein PVAP13_6NG366000 [Panicum virgatum]